MPLHILENETLRIAVSDAGAQLCSVWDKTARAERIWTADPAVWNRHAPILFPFVGRVMNGTYRIGEKTYEMKTQHGFARDMDFLLVAEGDDVITHTLVADDATKTVYPYDFCLTVRHRLQGRRLLVEWVVENRGGDEMFFSIGGHPGFLMPAGVNKEDCSILFPGHDTLQYRQVTHAGFALHQVHTLVLRDGAAPYREDIPDTWMFENGQVQQVGIALPDGKPYVMLECPGFPLLAVWANANGPFICLEPWYGRTDDEGFGGTIDEKVAVQRLCAGAKTRYSYSIHFC